MKEPNVITPALSDEELMEMSQKEYENPGWVDSDEEDEEEPTVPTIREVDMTENEEGLTELDYWDGDDSYLE